MAAALCAFSKVKKRDVICLAHVTNEMGKEGENSEKGITAGSKDALDVILITAQKWLSIRATKLKMEAEL